MFILECGINHFGNLKELKIITKFFLKSSFNKITFMCKPKKWYEEKKNSRHTFSEVAGLNFKLPAIFYKKFINQCKKKIN